MINTIIGKTLKKHTLITPETGDVVIMQQPPVISDASFTGAVLLMHGTPPKNFAAYTPDFSHWKLFVDNVEMNNATFSMNLLPIGFTFYCTDDRLFVPQFLTLIYDGSDNYKYFDDTLVPAFNSGQIPIY